jgi:endonuclease/exonuclease/phosphatase family metal-dependent hydrolase
MRLLRSPLLRALLSALALISWARAVEIRVATFNVELGLEAPGTAGHEAVLDILTRLDADVIGLQELRGADISGSPSNLDALAGSLATNLGWQNHHLHIASTSGVFDTVSRAVFISRFPIISSSDIVPPSGSKDMSRSMPVIVVDVPGTSNDPTLINVHLKCCFEDDDHFRRAVEMHRLASHLSTAGFTSADQLIILGDFNLIGSDHLITQDDFDAFSGLLPGTYSLGPDLTLPVPYFVEPGDYLTALPMVQLESLQTTGSDNTQGSSTLDYILATPDLISRPHATEIYSSVNDDSNALGLPKHGSPLPFVTSGTASDHKAVFGDFSLDSEIPAYTLNFHDVAVTENFDGSDGTMSPTGWSATALPWRGLDDGSTTLAGHYGFGPGASDPSLGILLGAGTAVTTAAFDNLTGAVITALQVSYDAEQWRSVLGGSADTWTVDLLVGAQTTALPDLDFTARTDLPTGPVPGGETTARSTVVTGLTIANTDSFELRFTATPGPGGVPPSGDVFLNELHYDNDGADTGEFVEVIVGPGFAGALSDLSLVFYNGSDGTIYDTKTLDTFTLGTTTTSGHRIYSRDITGIQNGSPDGIAIISGGSIVRFHSYEGSFPATDGPAAGMTSTDVGVSQTPDEAPGQHSLGLAGTGDSAATFTWMKFSGDHTKGAPNDGQIFTTPFAPQGIAIDNLAVTALPDTDLDGLPDLTDPDDDNDTLPDTVEFLLGTDPLLADTDGNGTDDGDEDADGDSHSNANEVLVTLTDPLDATSLFTIAAAPDPGNFAGVLLTAPALAGRTYLVQRSTNLTTWNTLSSHPGTGGILVIPAPGDPGSNHNLFRIKVSLSPAP